MAVKTLQQLRADITTESQKVDNDSITPTDVFGTDRDVVDSLYQILTSEYQPTLRGDEPQNIIVNQNEKRIELAKTLRNILNVTGETGEESVLKLFCNSDILRDPEILISKALNYLNALEVRLKTNNIDRLILSQTQTTLKAPSNFPVLDATANSVQIFDGGGNILISRDNNGVLSLLRRKGSGVVPILSASENNFTLYSSNTSNSPILTVTDTSVTLHDNNGTGIFNITKTVNGTNFMIRRGAGTKPFAAYDAETNNFTLFGNNLSDNAVKLIEQQGSDATIYYGIGNIEMFRHERVGGATGYSVSNAFGNGVLRSAIFKGTTAAWDALTDNVKSTYFSAILID